MKSNDTLFKTILEINIDYFKTIGISNYFIEPGGKPDQYF